MVACRLYSDVTLRYGQRCYATVYVYKSQAYWEVNQCPLPSTATVSGAEVAALTRGLVRAYTRVPDTVPITAYTDMEAALVLLQLRRFRGSFGRVVGDLHAVVSQRTNVHVLSVPRQDSYYRSCHSKARAHAKRLGGHLARPVAKQPQQLSELLKIAYDLGALSASHPSISVRQEADVMLTLLRQKYAGRSV